MSNNDMINMKFLRTFKKQKVKKVPGHVLIHKD